MKLTELIDLCIEKRIVCLAGGGGKTTLMYHIASAAATFGKKVLVTTTTHILKPDQYFAFDAEAARSFWKSGNYAVIGKEDVQNPQKLIFPEERLYKQLMEEADLVLIEADGAKRFPCKVPADYEPVFTADCKLVIGVLGMSALGKPLANCCFRWDTDGAWLNAEADSLLTEEVAEKILSSEKGTRKSVEGRAYVAVLNQCDDDEILESAQRMAEVLNAEHGIEAVCCSLAYTAQTKEMKSR